MTTWSYSSIKTFDQCPKKYYHLRVAKDVKDEGGLAAQYGTDLHKAAEDFVKEGRPLPGKFSFMQPVMDALIAIPGDKHTELKLGVKLTDTGFAPCDFFDPDVWWRGIVDLAIINDSVAHMVDYKSGKTAKYADTKQLDLMAGALFVHFPNLQKVKSALIFVVSNDFIRKTHYPYDVSKYFNVFAPQLDRLNEAEDCGVWNPIPGPLCGWCPVVSCEHYRRRTR
jgi:hypothetical protein